MKLSEISSGSCVAWSPISKNSSIIACGTVAGIMDLNFDASTRLDLYKLDLRNSKTEAKLLGSTNVADRFSKLCWSSTGSNQTYPNGVIAGGLANGSINIFDPSKIIAGAGKDSLLASCDKHQSPVQGLDFNPFQSNLLASGAQGDSDIFIWDLTDPTKATAYSPGAKIPNVDGSGISAISWNRKVQHILASELHAGQTSIWDLRAKKAVLQFHDQTRKLRCRSIAWNPEESTQIITASEDDQNPVIQLWDLKNVFAPVATLKGHTSGVWSVSWCPYDNDLLLSTGRDGRTLCWNVKTCELLSEIETNSQQWNFDVQWSTKNAAIASTCSLEGSVKIFSLQDIRATTTAPVDSSFAIQQQKTNYPSYAPKWLRPSVGARFGFGGKLFSFTRKQSKPQAQGAPAQAQEALVKISIVPVGDSQQSISQADRLVQVQDRQEAQKYADEKIANAADEEEKWTWVMVKSILMEKPRPEILNFLGFAPESLASQVQQFLKQLPSPTGEESKEETKEEEKPQETPAKTSEESSNNENESKQKEDVANLFGSTTTNDEFSVGAAQPTTPAQPAPKPQPVKNPITFPTEGVELEISRCLSVGNFELAVEICLKTNKLAEALVVAAHGGRSLWEKTEREFFARSKSAFVLTMGTILREELNELVSRVDVVHWKFALAIICTYAKPDDFPLLCSILGDRLVENGDERSAALCYTCSGNIERTVSCWNSRPNQSLASFCEKLLLLRLAVKSKEPFGEVSVSRLSEYASLLAAQGKTVAAFKVLSFLYEQPQSNQSQSQAYILLDRLYHSLTPKPNVKPPTFPFAKYDSPNKAAPQTQQQRPGAIPPQIQQQRIPSQPATFQPLQQQQQQFQTQPPQQFQTQPQQPFQSQPFPNQSFSLQPQPFSIQPTPPFQQQPQQQSFQQPPSQRAPVAPGPGGMSFTPQQPQQFQTQPFQPPQPQQQPFQPPQPFQQPQQRQQPPPSFPHPQSTPPPSTPLAPPPTGNTPLLSQGGKDTSKFAANEHMKKDAERANQSATSGPSEESKFIVDSLNSILDSLMRAQSSKNASVASAAKQKLHPMIQKLEKNEFNTEITSLLNQFCQALNSGDYNQASEINVTLVKNHYDVLGSQTMSGLKHVLLLFKN